VKKKKRRRKKRVKENMNWLNMEISFGRVHLSIFLKGPKYKKKISGWSLRHAPTEDIPPCPAMNGLFPGYPKIRGFGPDSRK
jgi:hypothetical protein